MDHKQKEHVEIENKTTYLRKYKKRNTKKYKKKEIQKIDKKRGII